MANPDRYAKALTAALVALGAVYATATLDNKLSGVEIGSLVLTFLVTLGLTYTVPNTNPTEDEDPENEVGDEVEDPTEVK